MNPLLKAAKAVVERWDTPLWKDVPATARYINDLRAAITEYEAKNPKGFIIQKQNGEMVQVYPPVEMGEAERIDK